MPASIYEAYEENGGKGTSSESALEWYLETYYPSEQIIIGNKIENMKTFLSSILSLEFIQPSLDGIPSLSFNRTIVLSAPNEITTDFDDYSLSAYNTNTLAISEDQPCII